MKKKNPTFAPSNSTTASFNDKFKLKREKRLRKIKKKKELAKKLENQTSAFGDLPKKPVKKNKVKPKVANKKKGTKSGKKLVGQKGKKLLGKGKSQKGKQGKLGKRKS